ncbi:MAG: DNA alkylation repair protein, partial [Bacteroidota bacterium]
MTTEQAIQEIKAIADPRAIKIWERGGMDTSKYLGANLTGLKKIAKKIGRDNDLAMDIWRTGFHDAKLLATYICEPKKVTEEQIDEWIEGVGFWDLAD